MPNKPKSSGRRRRASTTERTKRINSPSSDEDSIQLRPERTRRLRDTVLVPVAGIIGSVGRMSVKPLDAIQAVIQAEEGWGGKTKVTALRDERLSRIRGFQ